MPEASAAGRSGDGEHRARGADRDDHVARGLARDPSGGGRVVAGPVPSGARPRRQRRLAAGVEHGRDPGVVAEARAAAGRGGTDPVRRRPVAGAAGVAPVGGQGVRGRRHRPAPGQPVVGQADGGRSARRPPARGRRSQRSLVTVKEATGTEPVASAQARGPPLGDQVGGGSGASGCRSRAGPGGPPGRPRPGRPCRAAGPRPRPRPRPPARRRPRPPSPGARLTRRPGRPRSRRGGVRPSPDELAAGRVADHDLAGLGGGVDPGDQGHERAPSRCSMASWSRAA